MPFFCLSFFRPRPCLIKISPIELLHLFHFRAFITFLFLQSAWALEADEVRALLRDATSDSLVMVDELGRGTSSRDGAAVAGALLEALDDRRAAGIFATHLHELLELPLQLSPRVSRRRMGVRWIEQQQQPFLHEQDHFSSTIFSAASSSSSSSSSSTSDEGFSSVDEREPVWTYQLEDGVCTDSLALHTGRRFGLSGTMLSRAAALADSFDDVCRSGASFRAATAKVTGSEEGGAPSCVEDASMDEDEKLRRWRRELPAVERAIDMVLRHEGHASSSSSPSPLSSSSSPSASLAAPSSSPSPTRVPPGWSVPPALSSGVSCVYVIEAPAAGGSGRGNGNGNGNGNGAYYYVGETDAMAQRLEQHRRKKQQPTAAAAAANDHANGVNGINGSGGGANWAEASVVIVPAGNKSRARALEAALIRTLAAAGLPMLSTNDANHRHFSK
jgi:hypothetical protein